MSHYLLVAHQTATSPLLIERVREIVEGDAEAVFTVLVPETHVQHALVCDEDETRAAAQQRAAEARRALADAGVRVRRTEVGCSSPLAAIHDELRRRPGEYDAVLLSTFAPGISRWLNVDLPSRLERDHRLPVLHVYPGGDEAWAVAAPLRRALADGPPRRAVPATPERAERPLFASASDVLVIVALLALHALVGGGLALQYSRTFFLVEGLVLGLMAVLLIGLWRFGRIAAR